MSSGPRIAPVTDPSPELQEVLTKVLVDPGGAPLNIFTTMGRHPRLLKRFTAFGGLFLVHGQLPARERELVVMRTGWCCGSEYEWGQHVVIGRQVGVTEAEVSALARPLADTDWPTADADLLAFVDELALTCDVGDGAWASQRERWSDAQLTELVMLVGQYRMVAGFLRTMRVQREPGLPGWPEGAAPSPSLRGLLEEPSG